MGQYLLIYIALSIAVAVLGYDRKFGFWGYFFCSLLFSPLMGLLFVFASSPRKKPYADYDDDE